MDNLIQCQMSTYSSQAPQAGPPISISSQMSRSKSLNDLTDESQTLAFASTRCINRQNDASNIISNGKDSLCSYTPMNPNIHSNHEYMYQMDQTRNDGCCGKIIHDDLSIRNQANLRNNLLGGDVNQCVRSGPVRFQLCNHAANNFDGVTEQIGNLHL